MQRDEALKAQSRLAELGFDPGPIDGRWGGRSKDALIEFQKEAKLAADGVLGHLTSAALFGKNAPRAPEYKRPTTPAATPAPVATSGTLVWPTEAQVPKFFGAAGGPQCTAGVVKLPMPFRLSWDKTEYIKSFRCHEKVAQPMTEIFNLAVGHYGEAEFSRLGLDLFSGCYNYRKMRGGQSLSMHAYGIAVDQDSERNQLRWGRDRAVFARPEYEAFWQIVESRGAISLGRRFNYDWMHWQFARK